MPAPFSVLPTPQAIGENLSARLLARIETAHAAGRRFLLGCPTGRTPRPVYDALARRVAERQTDLSHLVLVMMDEYLVPGGDGLTYAPSEREWSCHHFAHVEIAGKLNAGVSASRRVRSESIWFPEPRDPEGYDARIADFGGVDFFMLASGATDGHVGFNPPGSERESRTRIIKLSDETRRDNMQTFPAFGSLDAVPRHGISVGIDTIASARQAVLVLWGTGKRTTLQRIRRAREYDPGWPATIIHDCAAGEIVADADAAS